MFLFCLLALDYDNPDDFKVWDGEVYELSKAELTGKGFERVLDNIRKLDRFAGTQGFVKVSCLP